MRILGLSASVLAGLVGMCSPVSAQPAFSFPKVVAKILVRADGTSVTDLEMQIRLNTAAAVQEGGQQSLPFSPSLETLEIVNAATLKSDGRVLPVALETIAERLLPAAAGGGGFDDRRVKVLIFRDLAPGDTLDIHQRRMIIRPSFPNQFSDTTLLAASLPWGVFEKTITAPSTLHLQTELHGVRLETSTAGDATIYHLSRPKQGVDVETHAVGPADYAPRAFISSFPDWAAFAATFEALVAPKIAVTAPVAALAAKLTKGAESRREKAQVLYDWVSNNVRYVNIALGIGGFEPHSADSVLSNRYGDCKDHTVLFHALLAASGIKAEMVLINYGNLYTLPDVVSFAHLNHAISYLPEFDLYADTTAGTAPFGTLPFAEYGKPVVHIASAGAVRRSTPVLAPGAASVELRTFARLQDNGAVTGVSTTDATGPFAVTLREQAKTYRSSGDKGVEARLKLIGDSGTGVMDKARTDLLTPLMSLAGSFTLEPRHELLDGDPFPMPVGLRTMARTGDYLLGKLFDRPLGAAESIPCWSGRMTEHLALTLPDGRKLERLPKSVSIDTAPVSYRSTWSQEGQNIRVEREVVATIDTALCSPELRAAMAPSLSAIRADLQRKITLAEP